MDDELGADIAAIRRKVEERKEADRQAKVLKKEEDELIAYAICRMHQLGYLSYHGADIVQVDKFYISDYSQLEEYIVQNRATDLLQKRLTESAVKLRMEDGIAIPGVGVMTEEKLKLS